MSAPVSTASPVTAANTTDQPAPSFRLARNPPGPRGLPVVGVAPMLAADIWEYPRKVADAYGDIARLPMPGGKPVYLISHPDLINEVFNRRARNHWKGAMLNPVFEGMLPTPPMPAAEGDAWKRIRKLGQPFFGQRSLRALSPIMNEAIREHVDRFDELVRTGATFDLEPLMGAMSMDVMTRSMFTRRPESEEVEQLLRDFKAATIAGGWRWAMFWAPRWVPRPYARKGADAQARILSVLRAVIAARRATPIDSPDLLNAMLEARFDDDTGMTDDELVTELWTFTFAGHDTTAAALVWTLALLDRNPDALAKAYAEVDRLEGRRPEFDDLESLKWLRACFDEGQRIQGIPFYSRDCYEEQELAGYRIPAGSILLTSPYGMQHDARYWREPQQFRPERWLTDDIEKYAYLAFGIGPRRCLGMHMAYVEGVLYLAYALQKYRFRLREDFVPKRNFHMSTTMKGGCPMTIEKRS